MGVQKKVKKNPFFTSTFFPFKKIGVKSEKNPPPPIKSGGKKRGVKKKATKNTEISLKIVGFIFKKHVLHEGIYYVVEVRLPPPKKTGV